MIRPDITYLYGTSIVSSCLFYEIENEEVIKSPNVEVYEVSFFKCNIRSNKYSVNATNSLHMTNVIFQQAGGACTPINYPSKTIRVQSVTSNDIKSDYCIRFSQANVEMNMINFSNNKCTISLGIGYGPKNSTTRFVSLISNECQYCAGIEADIYCFSRNSYYQFIENKCSQSLLSSYRSDCYCDCFFFINNNVTNCRHQTMLKFIFTNSFSTSQMQIDLGTIEGTVTVSPMVTELPFPRVMKQKLLKTSTTRQRIVIILTINLTLYG